MSFIDRTVSIDLEAGVNRKTFAAEIIPKTLNDFFGKSPR